MHPGEMEVGPAAGANTVKNLQTLTRSSKQRVHFKG
jgi:hypothetical protein